MIAKYFVQGINELEKRCPETGNVSLIFLINAGKINSIQISQTENICFEDELAVSKKQVITDVLKQRIFDDLNSTRIKYGTLKVSIDVKNGIISKYTITPEYSLNEVLLKAQIRTQTYRGKYESNDKFAG